MENNVVTPTLEVNVAPQKSGSPMVKILILIIFFLIISLVGIVAYLLGAGNQKTEVLESTPPLVVPTPAPIIEPTVPPTSSASAVLPIVTPTPKVNTNPNLKTFTSDALKISFDYLETQPDYPKEKTSVSISGNKIYVYMGTKPEEGQWVEVFKKDKNNTLAQAIKKQFLTGIAEKDCFVEDVTAKNKFPLSYKVAEIAFPYDPNSDIPFFAIEHKCPKGYTRSNGISFFLADANHPEIFLFFSIGQYGIMAGKETMWQDTIRFL